MLAEEEEAVCLELMDLLLQGLPLLLGCGIAVAVEEEEEEEGGGGEMAPEVAAEMLVEAPTVTADEGTCSLITHGCEVIPSEESAGAHGHLKPELRKLRKTAVNTTFSNKSSKHESILGVFWNTALLNGNDFTILTKEKMLKVMRASLINN